MTEWKFPLANLLVWHWAAYDEGGGVMRWAVCFQADLSRVHLGIPSIFE